MSRRNSSKINIQSVIINILKWKRLLLSNDDSVEEIGKFMTIMNGISRMIFSVTPTRNLNT